VQYADWSTWQRDRLAGPRAAGLARRWRATLAGLPLTLTLPGAPCGGSGPVPGWHARRLPAGLLAGARALAAAQRTTMFVVLAACCGAVAGRRCGQQRLVLGLALANRDQPELGGLLGFFVNSVPLPIDLTGDPRLSTLLHRVASSTANACRDGELPFEQIVAAVNPARDARRSPVVQVSFAHHPPASTGELRLAGCLVQELEPGAGTAKFELTVRVREQEDGGALLSAEYDATLVDGRVVADLVADYVTLLEGAAGHPEARLSDLLPGRPAPAGAPPAAVRPLAGPDGSADAPPAATAAGIAAQAAVTRAAAEVFGVPDIGADEDFFARGGHSLQLLELAARLRRDLGRDIALPVLYASRTVAATAAALERPEGQCRTGEGTKGDDHE
jgi:non-ribosomal peptide synthetase component F